MALKKNNKIGIVVGCFIFTMTYMGIINNTFSLFIISMTKDFGCARSAITLMQTITSFTTVFGCFYVWKVYEKIGMIRTLRITAFLLPAVYFCYGLCTNLPMFYVLAGIRGFLTGLATTTASVHVIKTSFPDNYGMPLGIALMGAGFGGFVFNNVAAKLMESFTWREIVYFQAILILVLVVFASFVLIRIPEGHISASQDKVKSKGPKEKMEPADRRRLIMCLSFVLAFGFCIGNLTCTPTPYFQDLGYSTSFAAFAMSLGLAASALGKPFQGKLADRVGIKNVTILAFICTIACLLCLIFFVNPIILAPFLIATFLSDAYSTVGVSLVPGAVFNGPMKDKSVGLFNGSESFGYGLAPYLSGYVFDICGSYVPIYVLSIVILIAAFPLFYVVLREKA